MKLYHRFPRLKYRRWRNRREMNLIRWAMTLKPGDLINDCSGFNGVIVEIEPDYRFSKRGWAIIGVNFTTDPGGGCSLLYCGVTPAIPRDQLEADYLRRYSDPAYESHLRQYWHEAEYEERTRKLRAQLEILRGGGHILDERGILIRSGSI